MVSWYRWSWRLFRFFTFLYISSLHFLTFSWNLLVFDQSWTIFAADCIELLLLFWTTSDTVVSSTYIQLSKLGIWRSLSIKIKSHGPSLVPWGTPAGTGAESEKQLFANLTRWNLLFKKSITQFIICGGNRSWQIFLTKRWWSIRSNAFL